MNQSKPILTLTAVLAGIVAANRFVKTDLTQGTDGANCYGVTPSGGAVGERVPVDVDGTSVVVSGAPIAAGALVQSDLNGKAITKAAGVTLGRMAPGEVATGADQFIEIIVFQN